MGAEFDEVGLVFLVPGGDEAVDLLVGGGGWSEYLGCSRLMWECQAGEADARTSPLTLTFSSSVYGAYHFARRVLPLEIDESEGQHQKVDSMRAWEH